MDAYNKIVDRYTYARLAGDSAAMAAILRAATEHDRAHPGQPPLMPLLIDAAFRFPSRAFEA